MKTIEQIIFKILNSSAHIWVKYWKNKEMSGLTLPGEYVEIRGSFLPYTTLQELFEAGFKIDMIRSKKIDADSYCDVLLKREIQNDHER